MKRDFAAILTKKGRVSCTHGGTFAPPRPRKSGIAPMQWMG